jgi:hypothetical protein
MLSPHFFRHKKKHPEGCLIIKAIFLFFDMHYAIKSTLTTVMMKIVITLRTLVTIFVAFVMTFRAFMMKIVVTLRALVTIFVAFVMTFRAFMMKLQIDLKATHFFYLSLNIICFRICTLSKKSARPFGPKKSPKARDLFFIPPMARMMALNGLMQKLDSLRKW